MIKGLFLSTIILLSSCQKAPETKTRQVVRFNIGSEPQSLDPRKARNLNDVCLTKMFFEGLTRLDSADQPMLAAAKSYTVSDDGKHYTFTLRNQHWSNGDKVTAQDFIRSFNKILAPDFPSDNAHGLYIFKNAKAIKEGKLPLSELGVKTLNDHTLCIDLEKPIPYFLQILSSPVFFPSHSSEDYRISNGPFYLSDWKHQDSIFALKNPYYWDSDSVLLDGLKMLMVSEDTALKMFENGELDWEGSPYSTLSPDTIPSLKQKNQLHIAPFLGTYWIQINTQKPPLQDINLRKALAYSLNRKELTEHVLQGGQTPATGIVPASLDLQTKPLFKDADFETASKLFSKPKQSITLLYASGDRGHKMAQAIQSQWKEKLGLTIELEAVESKVYFDRLSKQDYELSIGSWIADIADPTNFLDVFKSKAVRTNNTHWVNKEYQKLLNQSYSILDEKKRKSMLCKAEKIIIDEMPVIPIFTYSMTYVKNEKLKNVSLSSMGFLDFKNAYLEE